MLQKPKICCSIKNLSWFFPDEGNFDGYEIRDLTKIININIMHLLKLKELFKGKELSLHSQLGKIFSCSNIGLNIFSEAELSILKSEIVMAEIIGAKEIVFHMKGNELSKKEIRKFNSILDFAKKHKIEMIYENNACSEETIFRILGSFPEINFCLDIGHLNLAIHTGKFKMNLKDFVRKVKSRLTHIHAHNNFGEKDEHNSLDNGNFPWKELLNELKNSKLKKITIECNEKEDVLKSKNVLDDYFRR